MVNLTQQLSNVLSIRILCEGNQLIFINIEAAIIYNKEESTPTSVFFWKKEKDNSSAFQ